jgi:hypothetical protein
MKKGLTILVAAMVVFGLIAVIGSAAALVYTDTMAATGAYVFLIEGLAMMFVGTIGIALLLIRKQIESVFAKGLDPPVAHLTSAVNSVIFGKTEKLL